MAKSNRIDTDCINGIKNWRSIINIKEVVGNHSFPQTKYSNEWFNIVDSAMNPEKQNINLYTPVLYGTLILWIKLKIFTRSGNIKYHTLKIDFYSIHGVKRTIQIYGIPVEGHFKINIKKLYHFNLHSWTIKKLSYMLCM